MSQPAQTISVPNKYGAGQCPDGYTKTGDNGKYASNPVAYCSFTGFAPAPAAAPTSTISSGGANTNKNTSANQNVVNTNVTVSPQISPVFQQQFQPSNSPASAGTQQGGQNSAVSAAEYKALNDKLNALLLAKENAPPPAYVAPPVQQPSNANFVPSSYTPTLPANNTPESTAPIVQNNYLPPPPQTNVLANESVPSLEQAIASSANAPQTASSNAPASSGIGKMAIFGALAVLALLALSDNKKRRA